MQAYLLSGLLLSTTDGRTQLRKPIGLHCYFFLLYLHSFGGSYDSEGQRLTAVSSSIQSHMASSF